MKFNLIGFGGCILLVSGLVACADSPETSLQEWMTNQRNSLKPVTEPVSTPKKFNPQAYEQSGKVEPFSIQKLVVGLRSDMVGQVSNSSLISSELNRRKQPLEAYPLDAMSFVGSMQKGSAKSALLRVDKLIYQIEAGAYIGQNYGKIIAINEFEVVLREVVQDSTGEWIERQATLQLQEVRK